jgi:hypothetical protein
MGALKIHPRDSEKNDPETVSPSRRAKEVQLDELREQAFRLPASFVSGMIEDTKAEALDHEYLNGVLAAFHYLHSTAGEREATELLKRRRDDR